MVKIFGINLFGCSVCNGRKKRHSKNKTSKASKKRTYKGGYTYKSEKSKSRSRSRSRSDDGEDVTNSNQKHSHSISNENPANVRSRKRHA